MKINIWSYYNRYLGLEYIFNKTHGILYIKKGEYDEHRIREILGRNVFKVVYVYPMLHRMQV